LKKAFGTKTKGKNEVYRFIFCGALQKIYKSAFSGKMQILPQLFGIFGAGIQNARFFQRSAADGMEAAAMQSVEPGRGGSCTGKNKSGIFSDKKKKRRNKG
jgi:hypothetical protein